MRSLVLLGVQVPVFKKEMVEEDGKRFQNEVITKLMLAQKGEMTPTAYDRAVTDLVNFLEYTGEPVKQERKRIGVWVLLFLIIHTECAYLLKREYWKE